MQLDTLLGLDSIASSGVTHCESKVVEQPGVRFDSQE